VAVLAAVGVTMQNPKDPVLASSAVAVLVMGWPRKAMHPQLRQHCPNSMGMASAQLMSRARGLDWLRTMSACFSTKLQVEQFPKDPLA